MALPFISVVVPVRNEAAHLPRVLDQLLAQDYPAERMEILVADGASTDATAGVIRDYERRSGGRVAFVANPQQRSSAGRNAGLRRSRGDWVLFVDGHCHIRSSNMLRAIAAAADRYGAECIARPQPLTAPQATRFQQCVAAVRATRIGHGADSTIYDEPEGCWVNPASSGAGYSRKLLDHVGEFDESFDACEDVEFNWRVHRAGFSAWLSRDFTVAYQARASLPELWRQMMRYGRGRVRLARKHPDATSLSQWLPAFWLAGLIGGAAAALIWPALGWIYGAAVGLYAALVLAYSAQLARRSGPEFFIWAPAIYLAIHLGLGAGAWAEVGRLHRRTESAVAAAPPRRVSSA